MDLRYLLILHFLNLVPHHVLIATLAPIRVLDTSEELFEKTKLVLPSVGAFFLDVLINLILYCLFTARRFPRRVLSRCDFFPLSFFAKFSHTALLGRCNLITIHLQETNLILCLATLAAYQGLLVGILIIVESLSGCIPTVAVFNLRVCCQV